MRIIYGLMLVGALVILYVAHRIQNAPEDHDGPGDLEIDVEQEE